MAQRTDVTGNAYEPKARVAARERWRGALVTEVTPGSPAEREGLEVGMYVTHVNGVELRDMIDWDWEADGFAVYLEGIAYPGTDGEFEFEVDIERELGQDWGITFDGAVFDGMRLCRNDCKFCFMKMLPEGMRTTLYLRDDDYRLSFLQGNFVTLTNMRDQDIERVITCALSPLNVSIHAVTPSVRTMLMGRNASRGIEALEKIMAGGIEVHAQIVLCPGMNDGDELRKTLDYVEAHPLITSLGIVPVGFTRFQDAFTASYGNPADAKAVIDLVAPYQRRSRDTRGYTGFHLADEFYIMAGIEPPVSDLYDGYPQLYDGIGMLRLYLDEAASVRDDEVLVDKVARAARALRASGETLILITGCAAHGPARRFVQAFGMDDVVIVTPVANDYFGGNVNVTGLLTARDVLGALPEDLASTHVLLPSLMFNADGLTLDGSSGDQMVSAIADRGGSARVTSTMPADIISSMLGITGVK